uniref:ISXO2-like transposase domain-containing protein n=1 Tax=Acrobeloides nanus TaxID=290746 RepID=A0A914DIJ2_9BILA
MSSNTVVDWKNFCRDIAAEYCLNYKPKLGGPNVIVEIDETLWMKRKYERGRLFAKQVWVYGGVERGDFGCFMKELKDDQGLSLPRNAETLLPILQDQVLPGSIVMSDCWAAYEDVEDYMPAESQVKKPRYSNSYGEPSSSSDRPSTSREFNFYDEE